MTPQDTWTDDERAAMAAHAAEAKRARSTKGSAKKAAEAQACIDAIAAMEPGDRALGEQIHAIVAASAPHLDPKTWYGMPAWAKDGKVVVFFQSAAKFSSRYCTLGFQDAADLDDGTFWPTSYALTAIDQSEEAVITDLVRRAAGSL